MIQCSIGQLISRATTELGPIAGRQAACEAEWLLAAVLKRPRQFLYSHPEHRLTDRQQATWHQLLRRRKTGEPLAYLLGTVEFGGLTLTVNSHTLIPRPETELLVELIAHNTVLGRVADIGTGSGAIAIALASQRRDLTLWATDISSAALRLARANARRVGVASRITFRPGDLLRPLVKVPLDAIVANLPYLSPTDYRARPELQFEPLGALVSGPDGLKHYRTFLRQLSTRQQLPSWLYFEINPGQGRQLIRLLRQTLPQYRSTLHRDLTGRIRFLIAHQ